MGLFRTAGRVAVASSVHGRVQRRQRARWGEQERQAQEARSQPVSPPPAPPAPDVSVATKDTRAQLELLTQLGELRKAGVLTEEEFAKKKAKILS
ncbi:MAG: SHOCT domain-containing protein [Solirubrobacteraceae bacterium]